MDGIITVNNDTQTVSARELHDRLKIKTAFKDWFPRMCEYGFEENKDFSSKMSESTGGRPAVDYDINIDMAKEICMIQRTPEGKAVRLYLIDLEKAWNTPEQIMARALKIADQQINDLRIENKHLLEDNAIMKPKADYFDELVDRKLLTSFRDTAKELNISEKCFIKFLIDRKYIYRDQKRQLRPYSDRNKGLFELKEFSSRYSEHTGLQTLITPKGRETFRLLIQGIGEQNGTK